jgi:hypothetical protein
MGIRFYCPNGHRLHVKAFQAGKRGICPHCDARFRIPRESEIPRGSPRVRSDDPNSRRPDPCQFTSAETEQACRPANLASAPASIPADVLAEAPGNVWYVRPPSGGQYGPAASDVLQRWLDEGRVSADTLVWREGWPEWRLAGPLFPRLAAEAALPESEISTEPDPDPVSPEDAPAKQPLEDVPALRPAGQHKPTSLPRGTMLAVIVTLLVLIGVLVAALIAVANTTS